jgi:hypothetical protein
MLASTRDRRLFVGFAIAIFFSAFLLFQIQPLISKRILPWFGGSPAVWTVCLVFFQMALFAGYLYAHACNTWLSLRRQVLVHLAIIVTTCAVLRVLPADRWKSGVTGDPVWDILWMLAVTIGLPYFVLATTGPLLQAWFARVFPGRTPFRLYALSNLGSLLALVSYPFLFEPLWDLPQQAGIWTTAFVAFAVLTAFVAMRVWRSPVEAPASAIGIESHVSPRWSQFTAWLIWPACAVVVLMATTNHISTDVAAVPFLWVVPLALYLLTFIIAFDHPRWHRPVLTASLTLVAIYGSALLYKESVGWINFYDCGMTGRCARMLLELPPQQPSGAERVESPQGPRFYVGFVPFLATNFAALFGICLLCHGELARQRPNPRYLTSFYLMIAAGGAVGGMAMALVAPHVFDTFVEWKLAMFTGTIVTLGLVLHGLVSLAVPADRDSTTPLPVPVRDRKRSSDPISERPLVAKLLLLGLLMPASFVLLDMVEYLYSPKKGVQFQGRNFFGALTVRERNPEKAHTRNFVLLHGVTVHGSQFVAPERRGQPTTYYSTTSGVGRTLNYFRSQPPHGGIRIGDVGLGTGTIAAYAGAGDTISFYEIDPAIVDIATSGRWFTYVADAEARGATCEIKIGDGRLTLERESASGTSPRYHVLVLDAFSGDAVPVHLLTLEAFKLYVERLTTITDDGEDGALAVNISNRYLDLEPVVRSAAKHYGLPALRIHSPQIPEQSINSADWMILSHNEALLERLRPFARQHEPTKPAVLWTDQRSSLFEVLK